MINKYLGIPFDGSKHGPEIDHLLEVVHWFMLFLFVVWSLYFIYVLFRFNRSRQPRADYKGFQSHNSTYLEIGVIVFEALLLLGFAFPLWAKRVTDIPSDEAFKIHVIGEQFKWHFYYPGPDGIFGKREARLVNASNPYGVDPTDPAVLDDVVSINELYLPVGKPVVAYISSMDVIHSFKLVNMRITQDATPGINVPTWFTPIKTEEDAQKELTKLYPVKAGETHYGLIATDSYFSSDGSPLLEKGKPLNDELVGKLAAAGIHEVSLTPRYPMEVICAQLCGKGHATMRGILHVVTEEEFQKWYYAQSSVADSGGGYE